MRIEAVSVCVGYGDFLAAAAPWNLPQLDRWVVVTTPEDVETREVCRRLCLECHLSRECHRGGDPFNKGRLVNLGLERLGPDAWHLQLDADVVLPARARHVLRDADLDPEMIYGADRVLVRGWGRWQALLASGWLVGQHDYGCRVNFPDGYPVGARWANDLYGYCPIGFFQLWHGSADAWRGVRARRYPQDHGDAARGDVRHALQWDRRQRALVPELLVAHLESEPAALGANWRGRTTKRFGPPAPTAAPKGY